MEFTIEPLQAADWPQVRAIYLAGIATGQATFQTTAPDWTEWDAGHLKDAQLLPLSRLTAGVSATDLAKLLPKDKTVYAHCGSGRRVLEAAEILRKDGYPIEPLKTGYAELIKAGFEKATK